MEDLYGIQTRRQAVQENIEKAFGSDMNLNEELEKARSGVYADTAENRRLNRVGQAYGHKKQEEMPKGKVSTKKEDENEDENAYTYKQYIGHGGLKRWGVFIGEDLVSDYGSEKEAKNSVEKRNKELNEMKNSNPELYEKITGKKVSNKSSKSDVSSHASKASDGALKRAAADENASEEVRNAAKEELKKRGGGNDDEGVKKIDNSKGNEKAWNSVFKKLKHAENADDMYDNLWELGQKYDIDLDDYGDEEEMLKVIKEKIPYHEVANVINGGNDEKQWNSIFKRMKHAGDFSDDMYDNLWELGQKYDVDLDDYGDEEEMFKVIKNNIPIKEVQNVVSKYKRF